VPVGGGGRGAARRVGNDHLEGAPSGLAARTGFGAAGFDRCLGAVAALNRSSSME
jgi:hypothetical protein